MKCSSEFLKHKILKGADFSYPVAAVVTRLKLGGKSEPLAVGCYRSEIAPKLFPFKGRQVPALTEVLATNRLLVLR